VDKRAETKKRLVQLKEDGNPLASYIESLMTNMTPAVKDKLLDDLAHQFNFLDEFRKNMKSPEFVREVTRRRERNG
jgi:hypothetical protein